MPSEMPHDFVAEDELLLNTHRFYRTPLSTHECLHDLLPLSSHPHEMSRQVQRSRRQQPSTQRINKNERARTANSRTELPVFSVNQASIVPAMNEEWSSRVYL